MSEKKRVINKQLDNVDRKMDSIKNNAKIVTEEIQTMLENALTSAIKQVNTKTDQLMSDKMELERQLVQILYAETYIKEQSKSAGQLDFIYQSIGHNIYKHELVK